MKKFILSISVLILIMWLLSHLNAQEQSDKEFLKSITQEDSILKHTIIYDTSAEFTLDVFDEFKFIDNKGNRFKMSYDEKIKALEKMNKDLNKMLHKMRKQLKKIQKKFKI